jgi:hypothetical protein
VEHRPQLGEGLEAFAAVVVAHARRADAAERQVVLADMEQRVVDRHAAGHHAVEQHLHVAPSWLKG